MRAELQTDLAFRIRKDLNVSDAYQHAKFRAVEIVQKLLDDRAQDEADVDAEQLRLAVGRAVGAALAGTHLGLNGPERDWLQQEVAHEIQGYGPLQRYLDDAEVDDIIVNGPDRIYVERGGTLYREAARFRDHAHLMRIAQKIVGPLGRRVDQTTPFVDARLPDGSRVNVVVPPVSVDGTTISIRKFKRTPLTGHDLVKLGSMSREMLDYLSSCVRARLNVVISGGTGSGKSTLLNALSTFISPAERLVTIEDAAELQLRQPHVVRMETRMPNADGTQEVSARAILRNTLRMRPDRIIVGEVRGPEAVDMLQAMTTGHDGSMTTIHANSARDALDRLEMLLAFGGLNVDMRMLRRQIAGAINVLIHLQRTGNGRRRLVEIAEVCGLEEDQVSLQTVFRLADPEDPETDHFIQETRRSRYDRRLQRARTSLHGQSRTGVGL